MMHDLKEFCLRLVASGLGAQHRKDLAIFVLQCVEAMWARGDDLLYVVLLERRGIAHRLFLEQELVSDPARGVTRARFLLAKTCEADAGRFQQLGYSLGRLDRTRIGRPGAADPEEPLELDSVAAERNIQ